MTSPGDLRIPAGVTDTHLHVYDARYTTAPEAVVLPPDAFAADYLDQATTLGVERAVVVQPTAYGLDNRCQLAAMDALAEAGLEVRGVMVVDATTLDSEIARLDALGVCGARFHMLPGGAVGWDHLEPVARSIAAFGWHVQLQMDGRRFDGDLVDRLLALPCPVVVDHVGRFMPPVDPDHDAFRSLLRLLDSGRVTVKLSAPYESQDPGPEYAGVTALVDELVVRHPEHLMWATNWPHPGQVPAPSPGDVVGLLERWVPEPLRATVLVDTPARVYGF